MVKNLARLGKEKNDNTNLKELKKNRKLRTSIAQRLREGRENKCFARSLPKKQQMAGGTTHAREISASENAEGVKEIDENDN